MRCFGVTYTKDPSLKPCHSCLQDAHFHLVGSSCELPHVRRRASCEFKSVCVYVCVCVRVRVRFSWIWDSEQKQAKGCWNVWKSRWWCLSSQAGYIAFTVVRFSLWQWKRDAKIRRQTSYYSWKTSPFGTGHCRTPSPQKSETKTDGN
jgi:hypothetical protein